MFQRRIFSILFCVIILTPGCLDSLNDSPDPNSFWGEDCNSSKVPDEICKSGPAPEFNLVDQYNNTVNMSQFKDKIVVITFVFTNCPDICPAITYQMNKIAEELGPDFNESVVFLTVTVDPERDTPERLKAFASDYGASWQFLTSDAEYPVGVMSPIWQDYGIYVDIDEGACSGNGHYMDMDNNPDTPDECHCNIGYIVDPYNADSCIEDPDYDQNNITFEEGTLESDIIKALDIWSTGLLTDEQTMAGVDVLISQVFGPDWAFSDVNDTIHESSDYYSQNLTLVEFFHTDCSHCQNQVSVLKEFHANYSSNISLVSIGGYKLGNNTDTNETIKNFSIKYNSTWPYLYDDTNQMKQSFGLSGYPSWVLFDGDQIVETSTGFKTYSGLVDMVENHTEAIVPGIELESILYSLEHWAQFHEDGSRHILDVDMIDIIISALNYDQSDTIENYGVSHSSKLYIIDQEGNMRVVWRGYDWTYASVYHDIQLLL